MPFSIGTKDPGTSKRRRRCSENGCRRFTTTPGRFCVKHDSLCGVYGCRNRKPRDTHSCDMHIERRVEQQRLIQELTLAPQAAQSSAAVKATVESLKQAIANGPDDLKVLNLSAGDDYRAEMLDLLETVDHHMTEQVQFFGALSQGAALTQMPTLDEPEPLLNGFANLSLS